MCFAAPWCAYCKRLAPIWEEAAKKLKQQVRVGLVDVPSNARLGRRFSIRGFPTLIGEKLETDESASRT